MDQALFEVRHCSHCGAGLVKRLVKPGEPERLTCPRCGFIHYLDPKLAACALIELDGRIILARRSIDPGRGKWVLPGGFVDRGEVVSEAARREVLEETGLEVAVGPLWGLYSYPDVPTVVAIYRARPLGGELTAGDETLEVGLFGPAEIPWPELAFSSTIDALKEYCRSAGDAQATKNR